MTIGEILKRVFIRRYSDQQLIRECLELVDKMNNVLLPELESQLDRIKQQLDRLTPQ